MLMDWRCKIRQNTHCNESVSKTAILGGCRRIGEIRVAAEEQHGSVKWSLRVGRSWT